MVSRKYADDYRLENMETESGKTVTKPVYRGDLFNFSRREEEMLGVRRTFLKTVVIEWLVYFLCLLINCDKTRTAYVSLPLIAVAFPLLGESSIIFLMLKRRNDYKREEKDRISERLVSYVFITLFFSLSSFISHVVLWIKNGESTEDAVLLSLTAALIFSSFTLFKKRKNLEMEKTGSTKLPEEE